MKEYKIKINGNDYAVAVGDVEDGIATVTVNGTEYTAEVEGAVSVSRPRVPRSVQQPAQSAAPVAQPAGQRPAAARAVAPAAPKAPAPSAPAAPPSAAPAAPGKSGGASVTSPLPGVILDVAVQAGDAVKAGQKLMVLEAMKMENNINSEVDGTVKSIEKKKGDSVMEGDVLVTFE